MIAKKKNHKFTLVELLVATAITLTLWTLIKPVCSSSRETARRGSCCHNQQQIALALQSYHDIYNQFPPAYVTDKEGKPLYSWRILVLPFLGQEAMYKEFHLDESWDSPRNKKLSETTIPIFQCPTMGKNEPGMTNYVLITGPGTIWEEKEACSKKDIATPSETLMLTEVDTPDIHWAEPKDLKIDELDPSFLDEERNWKCIHPGTTIATFADGHTDCISYDKILDALKIRSQIKTAAEWSTREEQETFISVD